MALAAGVAQELSPFFDGTIGGHQGGAVFIATHDDLQEDFAAFWRQDLEPHVINDEEIGLEIFSQQRLSPAWVASRKARAPGRTLNGRAPETGLDRFDSDGLSEMALSHPGRANKKCVALLADKMTGGQFVDPRAIDGRIEGEVEVVQRADLAEVGGFPPGDCALLSHVEFVLENDFQELMVRKSAGFGFLEAQL